MDMSSTREVDFITPLCASDKPSCPELRDGDSYHVFISYSSCDSQWTESLISWLESPQCGLLTCYHSRDFVPGCDILENMTNCIQKSQKVLLVLSQDFVRSRWCLLEANMSLFRDCLERKPLVPVLLEPDITVPLHLCHITYLDAKDPEFHSKLLKVLCTPNHQMQGSRVVPYQPPSVYSGKALQPLSAVNEEGLHRWEAGVFSDQGVPEQLRLVLQNEERYIAAIRMVNSVSQTKVWLRSLSSRILFYFLGIAFLVSLGPMITYCIAGYDASAIIYFFPFVAFIFRLSLWHVDDDKYITHEMQKCTGEANVALSEEKILMGCQSRTKLYLVYVSLDGCKRMFIEMFQSALAEEMFQRALLSFSSGYACCLAKTHFPFDTTTSNGHLKDGVCFCQYVTQQLKKDKRS
ncbi:uncharacterized protein LOC134094051 [Sardina pilchardus]|uniref:uncharacterized protein LOC134094051 n=1 Tax=Sardina pilchardus TaxID=27697 RepID=UPI002E1326D0